MCIKNWRRKSMVGVRTLFRDSAQVASINIHIPNFSKSWWDLLCLTLFKTLNLDFGLGLGFKMKWTYKCFNSTFFPQDVLHFFQLDASYACPSHWSDYLAVLGKSLATHGLLKGHFIKQIFHELNCRHSQRGLLCPGPMSLLSKVFHKILKREHVM